MSINDEKNVNIILKRFKTEAHLKKGVSNFVLFFIIIDTVAFILLSVISRESFTESMNTLLFHDWRESIYWPISFLDGFIFLGYGIYVIKEKAGDLLVGSQTGYPLTKQPLHIEINGKFTYLLGGAYIIIGILFIAFYYFKF